MKSHLSCFDTFYLAKFKLTNLRMTFNSLHWKKGKQLFTKITHIKVVCVTSCPVTVLFISSLFQDLLHRLWLRNNYFDPDSRFLPCALCFVWVEYRVLVLSALPLQSHSPKLIKMFFVFAQWLDIWFFFHSLQILLISNDHESDWALTCAIEF